MTSKFFSIGPLFNLIKLSLLNVSKKKKVLSTSIARPQGKPENNGTIDLIMILGPKTN